MPIENRPLFICYRQLDGAEYAQWVHSALLKTLESETSKRAIYFDQTAAAVGNWKEIHGFALERAASLIMICTPGSLPDQGSNDWVHRELDWWLDNRKSPPIVVDTTNEGDRWIPKKILRKWPDLQRINLPKEPWRSLQQHEEEELRTRVAQQILGGVNGSEFEVIRQDLAVAKARNRALKMALSFGLVLLLLSAALGFYLHDALMKERIAVRAADDSRALAEKQRSQTLEVLQWVVAKPVLVPYGDELSEDNKQFIRDFISRLQAAGFRGQMIIDAHTGIFCLAPGTQNLAPPSLPIGKCDVSGGSVEYSLAVGEGLAHNVSTFVGSLPHMEGITVRVLSFGKGSGPNVLGPIYPERGTAVEMNEVASRNNGFTFRLIETHH